MSAKILIVDDQPDNLDVIVRFIEEDNSPYELLQALNAEIALRIVEAELPDLIITDWEMPGMNGIELIKQLKNNKTTSDIPVIMCTGVMTSSENLQTALNAGAVDYIRKPIDKIELIARIKSMLQLADSIKKQKKKLEIIKEKNSFISSLVESVPYPMLYYKSNGIIKGCNKPFEDFAGMPGGEIIGSNIYKSSFFPEPGVHLKIDKQLYSTSKVLPFETVVEEKTFYIFKNLFYKSYNVPGGILCIMVDITDLKNAHKDLVESKKRELAANAIRLANLNQMNDYIIQKLEQIHLLADSKKVESIQELIVHLKNKSGENIWKEFELHFNNVFEDFHIKLKSQFPDLTPGELKLCAFLRLKLTTKEIAALSFQNPKSIDMARYRLRKKLKLQKEENLIDYLMKLC